jgi:hypothetical protein
MRSTLEALLVAVSELRTFVESIGPVYALLDKHDNPTIRGNLSRRRNLDYTAFVITLYAAFEKFVEDLAWSRTELDTTRIKYSELSGKLRQKHLRDSAELLTRSRLGEGRYTGVGELDVVANLHSCLSDGKMYKLNRHAVVHHDMNLREDVVQRFFASLGVENVNMLARRATPMLKWFNEEVEGIVDKIPETVISYRLNDLVDRRNQVAHSGADVGESLAPSAMKEKLAFVEAYARSLFEIIAGSYLHRHYVEYGIGKRLEKPKRLLKDGFVAIVPAPTCRLWVGQPILGERQGQVDRWGEVMSLQVDGNSVDSVEDNSPTAEVGLRVSFQITQGTSLYVLERKDEAVWPLPHLEEIPGLGL